MTDGTNLCRKFLSENLRIVGGMTNNALSIVKINDSLVPSIKYGICHAYLTELVHRHGVDGIVEVMDTKTNFDCEIAKRYYDYILNNSVFSQFTEDRDWEYCYRNGLSMRTDISLIDLRMFAIAVRMGKEKADTLPLFNKVVEAGYDPNIAFIVFNMFTSDSNGGWFFDGGSSHSIFYKTMEVERVINFLKNYKGSDGLPASTGGYRIYVKFFSIICPKHDTINQVMEKTLYYYCFKRFRNNPFGGATESLTFEKIIPFIQAVEQHFKD